MTVTSRASLSSATETTTTITTTAAPPLTSAPVDLLLEIIQQTTAVTTQNYHEAAKLLRKHPQLAGEIVSGKTLTMLAIEKEKREIALLLIQSGHCKPQHKGRDSLTALHLAAWKGYDDVIAALVKAAPACINDTTTHEFVKDYKRSHLTALHIAAHKGHEAAAITLAFLGADLNATIGTFLSFVTPSTLAKNAQFVSLAAQLDRYAAKPAEFKQDKARKKIAKMKESRRTDKDELKTTKLNTAKLSFDFVRKGMSEAVTMMIENAVVDINIRDDKRTALVIACSRPTANHATIVRALCNTTNIKLKRSDRTKNNALHYIMFHFNEAEPDHSMSMLQNIIARLGTDISLVNKPNAEGLSMVHLAVKRNLVPIIQIMQPIAGVNWMQLTANGQNVIHLMIDHYDKVKTNIIFDLIQLAVDLAEFRKMINTIDNNHQSPLLLALNMGKKEVVSKFLKLECTLSTQYLNGSTCLHYILQAPMGPNTMHILKDILQTIRLNGEESILNLQDEAGNTAVHVAILHEKICALKELLECPCDLKVLNNKGLAPLHIAVDIKNKHIVELLVEKGADINQVNSKGETALHYAANSKDTITCNFLIAHGAKLEIVDHSRNTAATIATANQHYQLRKILDSAATSHSELEQLLQEQGLSFSNHSEFSGIKAINKIGDKTFLVSTPQGNTITVLKQADSVKDFRQQMNRFSKLEHDNLVKIISADAVTRMVHIERVNQGTLQDLKWTYLNKPIILELHHLKEIGLGLLSAMTVMCRVELDLVLTPQNVYLHWNYDLTKVTVKLGIFGTEQSEDLVYSALEEIQQVFGQSHATPTTEAVLSNDEETPPTATEASTSSNSTTIITEQAVKPHHVARWALLMYRIITRKRPYHDLNIVEVLKRANSGTLGSPESINGLDGKLKCILERCWSPKVLERPTASELSQLLKAL